MLYRAQITKTLELLGPSNLLYWKRHAAVRSAAMMPHIAFRVRSCCSSRCWQGCAALDKHCHTESRRCIHFVKGSAVRLRHPRALRSAPLTRAVPNFNPQNVPDPQVLPNPYFSAEEAVKVQLDALQNSNNPWPNHGIQTMYEFGWDIGGMESSRYFGMSKDLYHFDHFLGQFQNSFPEVFKMIRYNIVEVKEEADVTNVLVDIESTKAQPIKLHFQMARQEFGRKKNSYMTKTIKKVQ